MLESRRRLLPCIWIEGMPGYQVADKRANITSRGNSVVGGTGQNVNAADSRDMDDHFPIIRPAKREPRITFV